VIDSAAIQPGWKKWLPSNPTSAHWYDLERFCRLLAAVDVEDDDADGEDDDE